MPLEFLLAEQGRSDVRISRSDRFGDLSASQARELVRRFQSFKPVDVALDLFAGVRGPAVAALEALEAEGLLEERETTRAADRWWRTTTRGNALAMASFNRPIKRATADRLLAEVVQRAAQYNEVTERPFFVARLRVFGSYLRPEVNELSDVDVEVQVGSRDYSERAFMDYASASGHNFRSHYELVSWPKRDLLRSLRGGSTALSLVEEDVSDFAGDVREIYRYDMWSKR